MSGSNYSPHTHSSVHADHDTEKHRPDSYIHILDRVDLGQDVDIAIGATAVAFAGEQLSRAVSPKHRTSHLLKAGLGAVVALGALKMFQRDHEAAAKHRQHEQHDHEHREQRALPGSEKDVKRGPGHVSGGPRRRSSSDSEARHHRSHSPRREHR